MENQNFQQLKLHNRYCRIVDTKKQRPGSFLKFLISFLNMSRPWQKSWKSFEICTYVSRRKSFLSLELDEQKELVISIHTHPVNLHPLF